MNREAIVTMASLGCVAALALGTVMAQDDSVIQTRIANFREMGTAYKYIGDELKSANPNLLEIRESTQLIKERGGDMLHWFPPDSRPPPPAERTWLDTILGWFSSDEGVVPATDVESHAKPAIWNEPARFQQSFQRFEEESHRMDQVAQNAPPEALRAQFKQLGLTCKGCHDLFRTPVD